MSLASPLRAMVIADIESNIHALIREVLQPAGIEPLDEGDLAEPADVLLIDISQLVADPLAKLRRIREQGGKSPAIVLAAHFPSSRLRDLFHLGVRDIVFKPYRPDEVTRAIQNACRLQAEDRISPPEVHRRKRGPTEPPIGMDEIRLLSEIGRAVVSLDDLDQILARVVEAAIFVTHAEEANIYLAEADTQEVVLRASKQAGERHATLQRLRITDTLAGQVYRSGKPVMLQPMMDRGLFKVQTGFLVQSLIKTPVRVGKEVVGVLGVYNYLTPRRFTDHHLNLLQALADWAGVALQRAILLKEVGNSSEANPRKVAASGS